MIYKHSQMKQRLPLILVVTILFTLLYTCTKHKFTTDPQLKVKSISPNTVFNGDIIVMNADFTDAEGDIDSALIVYKWYKVDSVTKKDTFRYSIADIKLPPKTKEGEIFVKFEYNSNNFPNIASPISGVSKDTTATFGLILKDKAAHRSNYSESDRIRLKKV